MESLQQHANLRTSIFVSVAGLGTNLVGCYGNAVAPTPHWDRFAGRSLVADQFWMDGCDVAGALVSMWSGQHRQFRESGSGPSGTPPRRRPGLFVSDDPTLEEAARRWLPGEQRFVLDWTEGASRFEQLVALAFEAWRGRSQELPWLWIHSGGLLGPWDAPYEYRTRMCDTGDPSPPHELFPPHQWLKGDTDPDFLFGWTCGAGAQAIAMDETWEWLEHNLRAEGLAPGCLLGLVGVQGFPLGEHSSLGFPEAFESEDSPHGRSTIPDRAPSGIAYAERLHCPLIVRPGDELSVGIRMMPLVQPHDIGPLVDGWLQPSAGTTEAERPAGIEAWMEWAGKRRSDWPVEHRSAFARCDREFALLLPSWSARWPETIKGGVRDPSDAETSREKGELYVMPDDRWQQNEVSDRAPEILESISAIAESWRASTPGDRSMLDRLLTDWEPNLWKPVR